jgi:hypothetical protein
MLMEIDKIILFFAKSIDTSEWQKIPAESAYRSTVEKWFNFITKSATETESVS